MVGQERKEESETINQFTGYVPVPGYADPNMSNIELIIIQREGDVKKKSSSTTTSLLTNWLKGTF